MKLLSAFRFAVTVAVLVGNSSFAQAQTWPTKNLTWIVPFAAGGPTDAMARDIADKVSRQIGQTIIIENVAGAGGTLGAGKAAKANPEGYTFLVGHMGYMGAAPALYKKLSYDVRTDFAPVVLTAVIPLVLAVHPSLPVNTVQEFLAHVKANPGKLSYGSAGNGNITHLGAFMLLNAKGLSASHIPYKGSAPALTDLVGGQTQFTTDTVNSALPFIKDKRLRALAVTSLKRTSVLPDVPTLNETVMPNFEVGAWQGLLVPAKTPPEVVTRLNAEVLKALAAPDVKAKLAVQGAEPLGSTPAEYGAYIKSELNRWAEVVKLTGASLE